MFEALVRTKLDFIANLKAIESGKIHVDGSLDDSLELRRPTKADQQNTTDIDGLDHPNVSKDLEVEILQTDTPELVECSHDAHSESKTEDISLEAAITHLQIHQTSESLNRVVCQPDLVPIPQLP